MLTMTKAKSIKAKVERLRRGWTQTDLGHFAGMSAADISKIENGYLRPFPRQAARLADALGIEATELLEPVVYDDRGTALTKRGRR